MSTPRTATTAASAGALALAACLSPAISTAAPTGTATDGRSATVHSDWDDIGPGWSVVQSSGAHDGTWLTLTSPDGESLTTEAISRWDQVVDVSDDGARVLVSGPGPEGDATTRMMVIDLESRERTTSDTPMSYSPDGFLDPEGNVVLGSDHETGVLDVRDADGTVLRTLATSQDPSAPPRPLATPAGEHVLLTLDGELNVVEADTGEHVQSVPAPAGYTDCSPTRWWNADEATLSCVQEATGKHDVFAADLATGESRPVAVTRADARTTAWWTAEGIATQTFLEGGAPVVWSHTGEPLVSDAQTSGQIVDGVVYATLDDRDADEYSVQAQDLTTGETLWSTPSEGPARIVPVDWRS